MKKVLGFLLSLVLVLSCCSASLASSDEIDLDTVTGAVEYPWEGFRFDPPELYRNTEKGIVIMLGPRDLSEIVDFVPCLYYAMTPERYAEYKGSHELTIPPEELWTDTLFEVYICRKGMTLRQYCTYSGGFMTDEELEQVPEIARIGDTTWYLRMPGPNPYFLEDVDPAYLDDLVALRGYPTSLFIGRDGTVLAEPVLSADTARYHTVLNELLRQMNRK